MATLNDSKFATLRALGHTGAMSDMVLQWLQANGATSKAVTDSWMEMLVYEDETSSQRNDAWYNLLDGLAPVEIGRQLNDLEMWFWSGSGGAGHIPKTLLSVILQNSLIPARATGSSVATFTRASTATFTDFEGITRTALSGEPRFMGARRVENMLGYSEELTNAVWGTTDSGAIDDANTVTLAASATSQVSQTKAVSGGTGSKTIVVSALVWVDSGTEEFRLKNTHSGVVDNFSADLTATTTQQRFMFAVTNSAAAGNGFQDVGITNSAAGGIKTLHFSEVQSEDVTGQANQNPSEYVSTGVLSAPYHGANIDGVQYFKTLNGNTVASNVVTEATGIAITDVGADVVINGDFATDTDWSKGTGWSISGNQAVHVAGSTGNIAQSALSPNKTFKITYTISGAGVSNGVFMYAGLGLDNQVDYVTTEGTFTVTVTASAGSDLTFRTNGGMALTNVSAAEVDASTADASGPFGYISESAMTNSVPYSRDLTNAAWAGTATRVLDQVGMDGVPNSVCTATDDSTTASELVYVGVTIPADTNVNTSRVLIKKDSDETRFPLLGFTMGAASALYTLNTKTGATAADSAVGASIEVNSYGLWWEVLISQINVSSTVAYILIEPARSLTLGGFDLTAVGSIIVGNVELYTNTTIEGVKGRAVIFTEGSAVTKAADSLTYDDVDNIEDAAGNALMDASSFWGTAPIGSFTLARDSLGRVAYSSAGASTTTVAYDGTATSTSSGTSMLNAPQSIGSSWGDHLTAYFNDVADTSPADYDGTMGTGPIGVGVRNDGVYQWNGTIRNLVIKDREINASTYILFVPLGSDDLITSDSLTFKVVG